MIRTGSNAKTSTEFKELLRTRSSFMLEFQIILYLPAGGRGKSGCEISKIWLLGLLIFREAALRSKGIPSP